MNNQKIELTGRIVTPNDPDYNSAREEFNTFFNKFPLIIIFAQNTQDVVKLFAGQGYITFLYACALDVIIMRHYPSVMLVL
ncbi:hypothetical protein SAMN04487919_106147 [Bacillus sp. ok061]|nr:hypothetical protein SAMN04487919_106147 [Bacillus sp. ok061]